MWPLTQEEVVNSGVIPQVAALMGPCAAGTAYIPGPADFVPMVRGRGSMALAGPHLVRAAVGEDVSQEELGGSRVHCRRSGVGDLEVADARECIARIKEYLGFFGSHCEQAPPVRESSDPHDRMDEGLLDVVVLSLALWGIACGGDSGGEDGVDPQGPAATEESSQPLVDDSGLADEPLTAGGSTADHQDGNDVLREQFLVTVVEEGTGYVVSFVALEQRWDDYAELAEASLLSLSTE